MLMQAVVILCVVFFFTYMVGSNTIFNVFALAYKMFELILVVAVVLVIWYVWTFPRRVMGLTGTLFTNVFNLRRQYSSVMGLTGTLFTNVVNLSRQHSSDMKSRRFILVGTTGSGKSTTGNRLLRKKVFESKFGAGSVTKESEAYGSILFKGTSREIKIHVVDTPGLKDTGVPFSKLALEIFASIKTVKPGPHAFLFVTKLGRFTKDEEDTFDLLQGIFGDQFANNVVVVFTCKDEMLRNGGNESDALHNEQLQMLLSRCKHRYLLIDNFATDIENDKQTTDLLELVDNLTKSGKSFVDFKALNMQERAMRKTAEKVDSSATIKEQLEEYHHLLSEEIQKQKMTHFAIGGAVAMGVSMGVGNPYVIATTVGSTLFGLGKHALDLKQGRSQRQFKAKKNQ